MAENINSVGLSPVVVLTRHKRVVSLRLQNDPVAPEPEVGDPQVEVVSPAEGSTLGQYDPITVRITNSVPNVGLELQICYGNPSTDRIDVVYTGGFFRWVYNTQDASRTDTMEGDTYVTTFVVSREDGWPLSTRTTTRYVRFFARVYDSTGQVG